MLPQFALLLRIAPKDLQLEITEGLLLQNSPVIQASLSEPRAGGIWIALDDFGTGFSSISYLRTRGRGVRCSTAMLTAIGCDELQGISPGAAASRAAM